MYDVGGNQIGRVEVASRRDILKWEFSSLPLPLLIYNFESPHTKQNIENKNYKTLTQLAILQQHSSTNKF